MMKAVHFIMMVLFVCLGFSCKKKTYPESTVKNDVVQYFNATVNNTPVALEAGNDGYYMYHELMSNIDEEANLDFEAYIYESKVTLMDFARYIASSSLFVSTSTGPMHLAGASNSQTLSFFGDSLFASSKRWATVSDEKYQNNFMINKNYTKEQYLQIENRQENFRNNRCSTAR